MKHTEEECDSEPEAVTENQSIGSSSKNDILKGRSFFPYVVPSQNIPKRSSDKEVPLAQKIKSIARENRADIRHRKIVESNKELGLAIENEQTKFEDGFEDNNITDNNSHLHVMTSSTQVNLVDYRNYHSREDWSIADIICDKEPLE
ncbi:unnamed protein product [Parnassius apollo]|uniref:(apollo) hypothetical protein n=1 Tax=Parnassius apollo TaxID=110799 RepID=A0A8S3WV60_PARAO|nr:unnamed protein product [Parnassius apollo]